MLGGQHRRCDAAPPRRQTRQREEGRGWRRAADGIVDPLPPGARGTGPAHRYCGTEPPGRVPDPARRERSRSECSR